ncbi:glycosyltransferase family A protein [Marinobacter mobilis]|uniref:glycosyltransferase family A protein n=1 Tax=Marinobacter mobilis TaxID=488533 RepID=UPI0035C74405
MPLSAPIRRSQTLTLRKLKCLRAATGEFSAAPVVIAISHRNQPEQLKRALKSAVVQTLVDERKAQVAVLDDQSEENWQEVTGAILNHPAVTILSARCGSPARSRNQLLDWAEQQPHIRWVARLDADDEFAAINSLEALYHQAQAQNSIAAIGSNKLRINGSVSATINRASPEELLDQEALVQLIQSFCIEGQHRELPSCNLLLRADTGLRYPNLRSAEDHWLVTRLLFELSDRVSVVPQPAYAIYSLSGSDTQSNRKAGYWADSRKKLAFVAQKLLTLKNNRQYLLGYGLEGAVWLEGNVVRKEFYPWSITTIEVTALKELLRNRTAPIPPVQWSQSAEGIWSYTTPQTAYSAIGKYIPSDQIAPFLRSLYKAGIATLNIKRDNLRMTPESGLHYIDIGKDIQPLTTSYFLDMSARLYSIGVLGYDDEELQRRPSTLRPEEALSEIPGFSEFYRDLISSLHVSDSAMPKFLSANNEATDVTLLVKCCAQDADGLYEQVEHIVTQLSFPITFAKIVLLVDGYVGPFLRQYAEPDLKSVLGQAATLKAAGLIHEVLTPPGDAESIRAIYRQWFGESEAKYTHTINNAPLYPQVWAFSEIQTRYVLQCDCDVLIGRKSLKHDYLTDMLDAISADGVLSVGFNIPKATNDALAYHGKAGEFPPEVRFGLLDLRRIRGCLPVANPVQNNRHQLTWHRAIQQFQKENGDYTSLRGGNPASFYIHPRNNDKPVLKSSEIRDLVAQGIYPAKQAEQFDVLPNAGWQYPQRHEPVVFLLKGRYTPFRKLQQCLRSLGQQSNQSFGVILIDDASGYAHSWPYPELMCPFLNRYTLVRNIKREGHIANMRKAVSQLCTDPSSMIVVLDQDDCLMQDTVVEQLLQARAKGHDLIQMPMFRPNKPLKLYQPDYNSPRHKGGGNTWAHMRAFTKELFDRIPVHYLKAADGEWFSQVTDYATMLPMAELARSPVYLDSGYAYRHERDDYSVSHKQQEIVALKEILAKPALEKEGTVEPPPA